MENKLSSIAHCLNKSSKGPYSQSYGFSSRHVWIRELDHKEGWAPKNWYVQIVVLEKNLESPLDSKEIKPVNPEGVREWKSLSHVRLFATPWTEACQDSLSFTISWSFCSLMSIELVMPSNHLILCCPFSSCPQSYPSSGAFPMGWLFASGGQSAGASDSFCQWIFRVDFL